MLDHLVYLTADLDATSQRIGQALGVTFSPGGRHAERGTQNRLLRIGLHTYLELLAADPQNHRARSPRWMGVDLLPAGDEGRLARWAWSVIDGIVPISASGGALPVGPFHPGSRQLADGTTLNWQLTDPGTEPLVQTRPFLIDWLGHLGPTEGLPDVGVSLTRLLISGPNVEALQFLGAHSEVLRFEKSDVPRLTATLVNREGLEIELG